MKNILNKSAISILLVLLLVQSKTYAQPGVPPAPYCMTPYFAIPCNQPGPPNTPGNSINDFVDSFNTTGGVVNINNNNSTCNTQVLPGFGQVNYMYYGCQHYLQTIPGANIVCNIRSGIIWAAGFGVWIDWNQNNLFTDPGELVAFTGVPPAYVFTSCNFNVPAGQAPGIYRLRVRSQWITPGNLQTPCGATTYGEGEDYNVYVSMSPPGLITATASAVSTTLCSGATLSLTASSTYTGALTYTWTGPAAFTSTLQNPVIPNAQPNVSGIYTVVVSPGACPVTATVAIIVNPTPTVTASNNGPICQGGTINLTTPAIPGGTNVAYVWSGPGSYTSAIQNPVLANAQPSNSGVYSVTAVNYFTTGTTCQSGTTTNVAIVPVNPTSVTPSFTLCQGAILNLTASNSVAPTSYSWNGPAAFTSTLQNPTINNVLPPVSGDYTVVATFSTPGIPLICSSNAITNVSIVATSPVTVTVPNNICQGATANLTASSNPMPLKFDWTGPSSFSATATATSIPGILPTATGLYNVVATWAIGSVSCTINGANQINVVAVNPVAISAPTSVCYPGNVALYSNSPGAISYLWNGPNSFTSNLASPFLSTPLVSASGLYSVTTAYTNGALICFNSNTTNVTVNPILSFGLPPYQQVCHNSLYTVSGPAGATTYTWLGVNGYTASTQNLSIPFINASQAGTYTLNVNLGPCITSATTKVDILSPISFTLTPGNKVICKGDSVNLKIGSTGGSHNYAYVWDPQIYLGSPTGSIQASLPGSTTIYNVTGYDIACPQKTISTSFTVTVNEAPVPDLKLEKIEGCQPLCMVYNSRTQKTATAITYDFGRGHIMQADSFAYCLNEPGSYNLKIQTRGANGCTTVFNYPEPIVVFPTPHADVTWTPDYPSTTQNIVAFETNSQYGPVVKTAWMFQGANGASGFDTASVRNPTRTYDNVGKYPVMLVSTTDKGCSDTTFKVLEIKDEFAIYLPNTFTPNGDGLNDIFNIKGTGVKTEGYTMEIYDRWGTLLYSTKDLMKGWDGTVKGLNAENGVYVYKIKALGANGEGKKEFVGHVSILK